MCKVIVDEVQVFLFYVCAPDSWASKDCTFPPDAALSFAHAFLLIICNINAAWQV